MQESVAMIAAMTFAKNDCHRVAQAAFKTQKKKKGDGGEAMLADEQFPCHADALVRIWPPPAPPRRHSNALKCPSDEKGPRMRRE